MVYVRRDQDGRIASVSRKADATHAEGVEEGAPEVQAFLQELSGESNELAQSDIAMVRVLEDVIDVLIDKDVIRFTDLPAAAQAKLLHRRSIRDSMRNLDLLDDDQKPLL